MEERAPLDRHALQHTSKEPEAQMWAQIGTPQYNPNVRHDGEPTEKVTSPLENYKIPRLGSTSKSEEATKNSQDEDSDVELEVDENAETVLTENEPETPGNKESKDASSESKPPQKDEEDKSEKNEKTDDFPYTSSNDPRLIRARVFVGRLNTSQCTKKDVEKVFEPFGKILGVLLLNGYGFVQYEDEECAMKAIKDAHDTEICGSKIACDRPQALKLMLREERRRTTDSPESFRRREKELLDELDYLRWKDYERHPRYDDHDPYYLDRPPMRPLRDPYYDYPFERSLPPPPMDRYERLRMEELERARLRERYPPPPPRSAYYDRPRDDPYEERRRHRDPYDHYDLPPPPRRY